MFRQTFRPFALVITLATLVVGLTVDRAAAQAIDILFFGNSFTNGANRTVPLLVRDIAVAAGRAAPNVENVSTNGFALQTHMSTSADMARISNPTDFTEAVGFKWEYVVLQEFSTKPTNITFSGNPGDIADFRNDAKALYQQVKNHSSAVTPVLYETWARSPNNTAFYQQSYPSLAPVGPSSYPAAAAQMQSELRTSYNLAKADLDAMSSGARLARMGDAMANGNFQNLNGTPMYNGDLYHTNDAGYLLAALTLYSAIYQDNVSDINLTGVRNALFLTNAEVTRLQSLADGVMAVPEPASIAMLALTAPMLLARRRNG